MEKQKQKYEDEIMELLEEKEKMNEAMAIIFQKNETLKQALGGTHPVMMEPD
jgi:hypothetical protein